MPNIDSKYYIRIGSNSEKEFINKTISLYSGLIVKANLYESSPGMLSSIFLGISSLKSNKQFIIDPVTHVFTFDPYNDGSIRTWQKVIQKNANKKLVEDLHLQDESDIVPTWIREIENPTSSQKDKVEIRGIKKAYRKLADIYFPEQIRDIIGLRALVPADFTNGVVEELNSNIYQYQKDILKLSKYSVEKYSEFKDELPSPAVILSPYFCINNTEWLNVMIKVWDSFSNIADPEHSALVLHVDPNYLSNNFDLILNELAKSKVKNVFIWLNAFNEEDASVDELIVYSELVNQLNKIGKKVYNFYSGGFSIFLIPFGLHAIINGPGYGMDRDSEPVIGGLPSAQYYIPTHHTRAPIAEAFDLIKENKLGASKSSFHDQICNCPICQDGIKRNANDLIIYFGELGDPVVGSDGNVRRFPTQEAHERCKYHFMLSRLIEFRWARNCSTNDAFDKLQSDQKLWVTNNRHLRDWETALRRTFV